MNRGVETHFRDERFVGRAERERARVHEASLGLFETSGHEMGDCAEKLRLGAVLRRRLSASDVDGVEARERVVGSTQPNQRPRT
ncbi:MAG: hypothetical protein NVS2B3_07370 [Vulcanimicrobiaceae bacterium]